MSKIKSSHFNIATVLVAQLLIYLIFWADFTEHGYLGKFGMCWGILCLVLLVRARDEIKNRENKFEQVALDELYELKAALAKRESLLETVYEIKNVLKGA